ncbi:MAG: VanZ family protein [Lachnospiraceae bacterium]
MSRKSGRTFRRTLGIVIFVLYMLVLAYFLFFSESYGRGIVQDEYRYNLIPFHEILRFWTYRNELGLMAMLTNIFGNILAFVPLGFIPPMISRRAKSIWFSMALGFTLSVCVEITQFFTRVGSLDVDDVLLNTFGAICGYWAYLILQYIRRRRNGKKI